MNKKANPWAGISAEEKSARVKRMLVARAKTQAQAKTRPALPVEIEHIVVPTSADVPAGRGTLDDLAQLIVSVWRKL